jgi:hypothetical protein
MSDVKVQLSAEQRALVNTVHDFARSKFQGRALKYMDGTFPWENMRELAELGILGMAVPEEYGGSGLPVLDTALVIEEVAKVCYPTAMALMGEVGVQTRVISTYVPEQMKRAILPKVCTGEALLAVCMTEPHAGDRRGKLPDQRDHPGGSRNAQWGQNTDQPGRRGGGLRGVQSHQFLHECVNVAARIALRRPHQHADAPYPVGLPPRRERPCSRRTKNADKFAPLHSVIR